MSARPRTIAVVAALVTKGEEAVFVRDTIRGLGDTPLLIDIGVRGVPALAGDVPREAVVGAAGRSLEGLRSIDDRVAVQAAMADGLAAVLVERQREDPELGGVLGLGGSYGTAVVGQAMQALPLGFPKLLVSTLAGADVGGYIRGRDIALFPSVTDIAGLNPILESVLHHASAAVCAMAHNTRTPILSQGARIIALSMFGITTPCVTRARQLLEEHGLQTMVFHANGAGGRIMEELIESGMIAGVMDFTTTELADELVGGLRSAGPDRLTAAGRRAIPQLVCPGALDAVNFGSVQTVPASFAERTFVGHTSAATLMRTSIAESRALGAAMAEKLNAALGPVAVAIPLRGFSSYDRAGQPFHDEEADRAFVAALEQHLRRGIELVEIDAHINDDAFAARAVELFLGILPQR